MVSITSKSFSDQPWYPFLDPYARDLVELSCSLYSREVRLSSVLTDYTFVVFPMSKAYEGFLKKYLYSVDLISKQSYYHKQFRIGRSLNPDISRSRQDEWWLYDEVERQCGKATARLLWNAWIDCRNHLFHYFADEHRVVDIAGAKKLLLQLSEAMTAAMICKQGYNKSLEK